jgi:hypothetical protein
MEHNCIYRNLCCIFSLLEYKLVVVRARARIYPTRKDSLGVILFSNCGRAHVKSIEAWTMTATNDY